MGLIQQQTIKSSLWAYIGMALGFFTSTFVMPHILTTEEVGLIRLFGITYLGVLIQLSNVGFNAAGGRMFPYFRTPSKADNHGYFMLSCVVSLVGFVVCMAIFFGFKNIWIREDGLPNRLLEEYLWLMFPLTFSMLYFNVLDNYAKNLYDTVTGTFLREFAQRVFLLVAFASYGLGWVSFQYFIILWLVAMALPMVILLLTLQLQQQLMWRINWHFLTPALRKELINISLFSVLSGLTTTITTQIDTFLVKDYISVAEAGVYGTLLLFGTVIAMPGQSLLRISNTIIAEAWKQNNLVTIGEVYQKSCLTQLTIAALVFVGIVANLHNIFQALPTAYSANYQASCLVIIFIGLGKLFDMATGINGVILATSKYYKWDTLFFVALIGITIGLNIWLIPRYKIVGSAIATTLSILAFNTFRTFFVWYKFGFQPFSAKNLYIILVACITFGIVYYMPVLPNLFFLKSYMLDTLVRSGVITAIFVGLVYGCELSPEMNNLIKKYTCW